jgi:hypothetical protein
MAHKKHKVRLFTWFDGRLFTEDFEADSHEEAKTLARDRGPHSFKIYDAESGEVQHTEICDSSAPLVPDYA